MIRKITSCLFLAVSATASGGASAQIPERLTREVPRLMEAAEIPGLQVAWIDHDRIAWTGAFGVRDADTGTPVNDGTIFEAASLSKPVVAYVALRLIGRGELDLDTPLWDDIGYERLAHDERARSITTRMVLTHTTGLPNWGDTPLRLIRDPGQSWSYSGEGFVFLATMLEQRTGLPLERLVQREVFDPLGMIHSSFVWETRFDSTAATPHDLLARPRRKNKPTTANAAASLHTTATEYARFVIAVLTGEGLDPDLAAMMREPLVPVEARGQAEASRHLAWGLGWGIQDGERGRAIWHWGDNGNFRCFVIAFPEREQGLVYFTNSNSGLAIAGDLVSIPFPDTPWSVRWLDYAAWDQTQRVARIALRRAFLGTELDSAWALYEQWHDQAPDDVGERELGNLGQFLLDDGHPSVALAVLERRAREYPSDRSLVALGEARTALRQYAAALSEYQKAIDVAPKRAEALEPRLAWLREGIAGSANPAVVSAAQLGEFVGTYGPRTITRRDSTLWYQRDDREPVRLFPLTESVFAVESVPTFRIRFERDAAGAVIGIVGLYSDGRTDETPRSR